MMSSSFRNFSRWFSRLAIPALLVAAVDLPSAWAHPHVWVTTHSSVLYENGAIIGLRHAWTFDQYYTEMAIEGLDKNNDGKYTREELAELAKINVEALKEFAYFTHAKLAGADLKVAPPKDYHLEHKLEAVKPTDTDIGSAAGVSKKGAEKIAEQATKPVPVLTLHFTLPLAKPVLAEAEGFSFSVGDPTFFIAFEPAAENPVTLDGAPKNCRVAREDDTSADANPSKPGDLMASLPSDLSINIVSAPVWKVHCRASG